MENKLRLDYRIGPTGVLAKQYFAEDLLLSMAITDIISSEFRTRYAEHDDLKIIEKTFICFNNEIAKSKIPALSHLETRLNHMAEIFPNYELLFPPWKSNKNFFILSHYF